MALQNLTHWTDIHLHNVTLPYFPQFPQNFSLPSFPLLNVTDANAHKHLNAAIIIGSDVAIVLCVIAAFFAACSLLRFSCVCFFDTVGDVFRNACLCCVRTWGERERLLASHYRTLNVDYTELEMPRTQSHTAQTGTGTSE